jgi:hypothetical protein
MANKTNAADRPQRRLIFGGYVKKVKSEFAYNNLC